MTGKSETWGEEESRFFHLINFRKFHPELGNREESSGNPFVENLIPDSHSKQLALNPWEQDSRARVAPIGRQNTHLGDMAKK